MNSKLIALGVVLVLVLGGLLAYQKFFHTEVATPQADAPKEIAVEPLTQEQKTGIYTEPVANKFVYPMGVVDQNMEIAVDSVAVSGLTKAASTVSYTVTLGDPTNGKWVAKGFKLFNRTDGKAYPMVLKEISKKATGVRTVRLTFTAVPSATIFNNQVVFSFKAPTDDAGEVVLLLKVPKRAEAPTNDQKEAAAAATPATPATKAPVTKAPVKAPVTKKAAVKKATVTKTTKKG